jgi:hypothetical protein
MLYLIPSHSTLFYHVLFPNYYIDIMLSSFVPVNQSIDRSIYLSIYLIYLIYLSIYPSKLSVCLSIYLICPSSHPSTCLVQSCCNITSDKNKSECILYYILLYYMLLYLYYIILYYRKLHLERKSNDTVKYKMHPIKSDNDKTQCLRQDTIAYHMQSQTE